MGGGLFKLPSGRGWLCGGVGRRERGGGNATQGRPFSPLPSPALVLRSPPVVRVARERVDVALDHRAVAADLAVDVAHEVVAVAALVRVDVLVRELVPLAADLGLELVPALLDL